MNTARVFDIQRFSIHDGPGIRTTVFWKGCHNHCTWCHNPESQMVRPQIMLYPERCTACGRCGAVCERQKARLSGAGFDYMGCTGCGQCMDSCPIGAITLCGRCMTADELMEAILTDQDYFIESGGGVTFSGGEPVLYGGALLQEIMGRCKEHGVHTAMQTAGNYPFEMLEPMLSDLDLIMVDYKTIKLAKFEQYIGEGFELVEETLRKLKNFTGSVVVRTPVIGGFNDSEAEIEAIAKRLSAYSWVARYDLLPYHSFGLSKYERLTGQPLVSGFYTPPAARMAEYRKIVESYFPSQRKDN